MRTPSQAGSLPILSLLGCLLALAGCNAFVSGDAPPGVLSLVPADGAKRVSRRTTLAVTFSKPMNRDTFALQGTPALPDGHLLWAEDGLSAVFVPGAPFEAATQYVVDISATSAEGQPLSGRPRLAFETDSSLELEDFALMSSVPADGAPDVSVSGDVELSFSQAVDLATAEVRLVPGGALSSVAVENEGRTVRYRLNGLQPEGDYRLEIRARSVGGSPLRSGAQVRFRTGRGADRVAPSVVALSPAAGLNAVPTVASLVVSFSEPMDRASVEAAIQSTPAVGCAGRWQWDASGTLVSCKPQPALSGGTRYNVTVGTGAKDVVGNPLAAAAAFQFNTTTAVDGAGPSVQAIAPNPGMLGVARNAAIRVLFSEPMDIAQTQGAFAIASPAGMTGSFTWSNNNTLLNFVPTTPFPYGETVSWSVSTGAKDLAGNSIGGAVQGSFRAVRYGTVRLTSIAAYDGMNTSDGSVASNFDYAIVGDGTTNVTGRGYFTFDLGAIPGETSAVLSATFGGFQSKVEGAPYTKLGALLLDHVYYDTLDASDYNAPVGGAMTYVLSTSETLGYKMALVTPKVRDDLANRGDRGNKCQFRARYEKLGPADGKNDNVLLLTGEAPNNKPYLDVSYEYP